MIGDLESIARAARDSGAAHIRPDPVRMRGSEAVLIIVAVVLAIVVLA